MPDKRRLPLAIEWAHRALADRISAGSWVVDATAGNGHDTLFLAREVGCGGRVFAFDVQKEALEETRHRLVEAHIPASRYTLILDSHARMKEALPAEALGRIRAVVLNLGFRPGGDKRTTTQCSSTLAALTSAAALIAPGGIITTVAYPGHASGETEAEQVAQWMRARTPDYFEVQNIRAMNRIQPAPELWLALRLGPGQPTAFTE